MQEVPDVLVQCCSPAISEAAIEVCQFVIRFTGYLGAKCTYSVCSCILMLD